jgi:hypothetical protein
MKTILATLALALALVASTSAFAQQDQLTESDHDMLQAKRHLVSPEVAHQLRIQKTEYLLKMIKITQKNVDVLVQGIVLPSGQRVVDPRS